MLKDILAATLAISHIVTVYSSSKTAFFTSSSLKACFKNSEIRMKTKQNTDY